MRQRFIKKSIVIFTVFFLVNLLLLLSIKGYNTKGSKHELEVLESVQSVDKKKLDINGMISIPKTNALLPIVVFGCNRPLALQLHIQSLLQIRKNAELNPIIISLDCQDNATINVAKSFGDQIKTIIELPDLGPPKVPPKDKLLSGYYRIARHYGYSLNHVLSVLKYEAVIITEDDLEISPDFLDYFQALYPLLKYDETLWCVSAWNDNGIHSKIDHDPELLHRCDFFPGLGWLLTQKIWNELKDKWPQGFWDDWMRQPQQRRKRACIRPEVPRTAISPEGKRGVSGGQFYDAYLRKILKNTVPVDWKSIDMTYLIKDIYDPAFQARIDNCSRIMVSDLNHMDSNMKCAQLHYSNNQEFAIIANTLKIMNDFKSNVPRTAYRGVVQTRHGNTRIYITPSQRSWRGY